MFKGPSYFVSIPKDNPISFLIGIPNLSPPNSWKNGFMYHIVDEICCFVGGSRILLIFISFIFSVLIIYLKIAKDQDLSDTAFTMLAMFSFLIGIQFIIFGLIADMVVRTGERKSI